MGFKQLLDSLKLSSKDAIVDGEKDSLTDLKKYLHIDRPVEHDLSKIILDTTQNPESSLILLLGNVGDGKSHLLARMWELHGAILKDFKVLNDATESVFKNKTYLENLFEVFAPYSDSVLAAGTGSVKTIVAINLGTLTNFLEEASENFSMLKNYVELNHLVDQQYQFANKTIQNHFVALNLTDYHIFSLSANGVQSQVLIDIINKITTKIDDNPFYRAYKSTYENRGILDLCPIKYNFDLLSQQSVQKAISGLIVKIILADKLIISVRLLMNLIYDLIVAPPFSQLSDDEIENITSATAYKDEFYYHTLSVLLFNSPATSNILKSTHQYDPVSGRTESLDELIITLSTAAKPSEYFSQHKLLDNSDPLFSIIPRLSIQNRVSLFMRLHFLKTEADQQQDTVFKEFVSYLYDFNTGKKMELLSLYQQISNAVYQWNGTTQSEADYINLDIGRRQSTYKISQKLQLEFLPVVIDVNNEKKLDKFHKNLNISFQVQGHKVPFLLEIDFLLFELISKINKGYRPNRVDKSIHVKFTQFVNELVKFESSLKELIIQEFNGESKTSFKLSFIPGFNNFKFTEI